MVKNEIPADVRRFVLTRIPSVPHIEALMLLRASAPDCWSAASLAPRLYVRTGVAAAVLGDLHQSGMLRQDSEGGYFFVREPGLLGDVIEELAVLYGTHLVEITMLIHSKLDRKAQQFADAFDFRKEI